jgi:hypothetical protein
MEFKRKRKRGNIMDDKSGFSPQMTKREFLKLCGTSFCMFSFGYLSSFPKTSQGQIVKKVL